MEPCPALSCPMPYHPISSHPVLSSFILSYPFFVLSCCLVLSNLSAWYVVTRGNLHEIRVLISTHLSCYREQWLYLTFSRHENAVFWKQIYWNELEIKVWHLLTISNRTTLLQLYMEIASWAMDIHWQYITKHCHSGIESLQALHLMHQLHYAIQWNPYGKTPHFSKKVCPNADCPEYLKHQTLMYHGKMPPKSLSQHQIL